MAMHSTDTISLENPNTPHLSIFGAGDRTQLQALLQSYPYPQHQRLSFYSLPGSDLVADVFLLPVALAENQECQHCAEVC